MGNCITYGRVLSYDSEWDLPKPESSGHCTGISIVKRKEEKQVTITKATEQEDLKDLKQHVEVRSAVTKPTQMVRIKISKKQLAELLRQAESQGVPMQHALARLSEPGKRCRVKRRMGQYWTPVLQSIPEIAE